MKRKITALISSIAVLLAMPLSNISAASKTLNVQTYMSSSELGVYGIPYAFNNRLPLAESGVYAFYKAIAGITVNINFNSSNGGITTYNIDSCKDSSNYESFRSLCTCSSTCQNSSTYHHTNVYNVRKDWNNKVTLSDTNRVNMLITPIRLCTVSSSVHKQIRGKFFATDNKIILQDFDFDIEGVDTYRDYEIKYFRAVMIHEIGHMYGTPDHTTRTGDSDVDNCLWGYYKDSSNVVTNLLVCDECTEIIQSNASRYNHS